MEVYSSSAEKAEIKHLKKVYHITGKEDPRLGLIKEAARLHVLLDITWTDMAQNGTVEMFQQSERCAPYERERPVVKQYQTYNKQYQAIIKQLNDSLKNFEEPDVDLESLLNS